MRRFSSKLDGWNMESESSSTQKKKEEKQGDNADYGILCRGDPWNQTAADLPDWLERFKRDIGLLPRDTGPGLGLIKRTT